MLSDVRGCDRNRADGHSWKRYGQDEMLPARILVDMSDVLNELYESYGETTKVNLYSIDLKFTDFDQVDAIEVPEEVKEAAGE